MSEPRRKLTAIALWAIGLVIAVALGSAIVSTHRLQDRSFPAYRGALQTLTPTQPPSPTTSGPTNNRLRSPCQNPVDEAESALCANWRAALAAEDSALWAMFGVLVAVLGSGFLIWQIGLTRRAVLETATATQAMLEANRIAREGNRAWISCEDIRLTRPVDFNPHTPFGERYDIQGTVTLINTGDAIANAVRLHVDIVTMETVRFRPHWEKQIEQVMAQFAGQMEPWMGVAVAPGGSISLEYGWGGPVGQNGPAPTYTEVRGGAFFLLGVITYTDHHGVSRLTRFAFHPDADSVRPWNYLSLRSAGGYGSAT